MTLPVKVPAPESVNTDDGEDDDFAEDEAEDGLHSTVLIVSTKDSFTLKQDVCMCCGSFGKGREGYLIGCVQCGQCFHPYCVNVKVCIFSLDENFCATLILGGS